MSENAPEVNIEVNDNSDQAQDATPVANQGETTGQEESNLSETPKDVPVDADKDSDED